MPEKTADHHNPYGRDNVRRGILHYLTGRTLAGISAVATVVLLARYMDIVAYAGYTALTGLLVTATLISDLGINRAIARYVPEGRLHHSPQALARFIWKTALARLLAAFALTSLIYLGWPALLRLFAAVQIGYFPWALACYLLATVLFQHFTSVMQSLVLQKMLTRLTAIQWGGRLSLILLFVWQDSAISLNQALWVMALPELGIAFAFVWFINRHLRLLARLPAPAQAPGTWPNWREIKPMALHNYSYNLLGLAPQGYFMRMVVAALMPAPFVAAYGFFLSLIERARQYLPLQLMLILIEPVVIANYLKDRDFARLSQRTQLLYKTNLLILAPALVTVALYGDDISRLLTGDKFLPYVWLLGLFIVQLIIANHMLTTQLLLNAVGESDILTKTGIFSLAIMALAAFVIVAGSSFKNIVFAPLAYDAANNLFALHLLRKRGYRYTPPWNFFLKLALVSVAAYVASLLFHQAVVLPTLMQIGFTAGIATLVFAAGYFLSRILDAQDTQTLLALLPRSRFLQHSVRP